MSAAGTASDAGNGPMTIDQTVDFLDSIDKEEEQDQPVETPEAPPAATPNTEAEPAANDATEAEKPDGSETAETPEAETPIEPPQFWSTEAKARFRDVPRDVQEVILAQEQSRNAFTSKAAQEANETRKAAEAERERFGQMAEQLGRILPQAEQTFADRWANVDWVSLTDQIGAEAAQKLKFQHDAEREKLTELKQAKTVAETETVRKFMVNRMDELKTLAPEFVDPKTAGPLQTKVLQYASEVLGYQPDAAVRGMTAKEALTIHKAMLWDEAQAKTKSLAAQKKPAAAQQPARTAASRPTVPGTSSTPANNRLAELSRKRSLSIDEATELMNLKDKDT